jgi:hypothetical protein
MRRLLLVFLALVSLVAPAAAQEWESTRAGTVRVLHAPRHRSLAREVLASATRPMALPGFGEGAVPDSATIVLAPTPAAFAEATGGGAPEWAGGIAIPALRRIVLPVYPSAGVRQEEAALVLRHEVAHLALAERLPGRIPRWFNEGYAEVASGAWDVEGAWQLRLAILLGRLPPLDSLSLDWPRDAGGARFAYLLSATAVEHLRRLGGERGFTLLMRNWQETGDFEPALRMTYGMTLGHFEDSWAKDVRNRYGWLLALSNVAVVWVAASLLLLVAWFPRRRRNRRRIEAMRAEERLLPPPDPDSASVVYPLEEPPPPPEWELTGDRDRSSSG